jgi:hypothetical protein
MQLDPGSGKNYSGSRILRVKKGPDLDPQHWLDTIVLLINITGTAR